MTPANRAILLAIALFLFGALSFPQAQSAPDPDDLERARDRQKEVQSETDLVVKRVSTMLRVLKFYGADKGRENQLLEEVAETLRGLSRDQMAEVIERLGKAARTQDPGKSDEELLKAHERHLEIVESLNGILAKYDSVRNLDQAAERLEKLAKTQLELYLLTNQVIRTEEERFGLRQITPAQRTLLNQKLATHQLGVQRQGSEQAELDREVNRVMDHIKGLFSKLPDGQQERVTAMQRRSRELRLQEHLTLMVQKLKTQGGAPQAQVDRLRDANELQKETYANLLELSRILRSPADPVAALTNLREEVARELTRQDELKNETQNQQAKESPEQPNPPQVPGVQKNNQVDQLMQAYLENIKLLQAAGLNGPFPPPPPSIMNPRVLPARPGDPQRAKAMEKVQELGKQQARLGLDASKTRGLLDKHAPAAANEMSKAEQAMDNAKEQLDRADPSKAAIAQLEASEALKNTLKELDAKIAQLKTEETNPLANLERANEKLAEIIKDQQDVHARTKESAEKPSFKNPNLADKQTDLAERTNALQDQPLPNQPKTQEALDKANQAMSKAAQNLKEQKPGQAAARQQEAMQALQEVKNQLEQKIAEMKDRQKAIEQLAKESEKLDGPARDEVNKKLAELRAEQIKEQQAMQPGKTDPLATRNQLEQALQQAKQAQQQTQQAQQPKNNQELAQIQKEIVKKAAELNLPDARDKAKEAEEALKEGDLNKAVEKQQQALDEIKKGEDVPIKPADVKDAPEPMEAQPKPNQAQPPAQAKNSPPPQGQPKPSQAKPNRPTPQQAKPAESKPNQANPTENKASEQKPNESPNSEAKQSAPKQGDPKQGESKQSQGAGKPKAQANQPRQGAPKQGQAKSNPAKTSEAKPNEPNQGEQRPQAKSPGEPKSGAKTEGEKQSQPTAKQGECKGCEGKSGSCAKCAGNKSGSGQQAQAPSPEQAKSPLELGQAQKDLLEQTKPLAKAQETTQAAKNALDQAQAQAPQPLQEQLDRANKQLARANDELARGNPEKAAEAQEQAAQQIEQALQALDKAMENMSQEPSRQQAQSGKPGGKPGSKPGSKPGEKPGQAKGPSKENNIGQKGKGDRDPNGPAALKTADSKLNDVTGDGAFLHLPPREREMIRQALSGNLPPEYAAEIQQYFINIARGRQTPAAPTGK